MTPQSLLIRLSILCFLACLTQDAFYLSGDDPTSWSNGLGLLFFGWMGHASWLANPAVIAAWLFFSFERTKISLALSACALVAALSFLQTETLVVSTRPDNETVVGYGMGYWLWLASICAALLAAGAQFFSMRRTPT